MNQANLKLPLDQGIYRALSENFVLKYADKLSQFSVNYIGLPIKSEIDRHFYESGFKRNS